MKEAAGTTQLALRISNEALRRAESLRPKLSKNPDLVALGAVTRSTVLKLALMRGLEALEREYK